MRSGGYYLTGKEASDLFILLSHARLKLSGKYQTEANKYYKKFEEALVTKWMGANTKA